MVSLAVADITRAFIVGHSLVQLLDLFGEVAALKLSARGCVSRLAKVASLCGRFFA